MLPSCDELRNENVQAVRFATPDSLEGYSQAAKVVDPIAARTQQLLADRLTVGPQAALEESFFLGLRMNRGVSLARLRSYFGDVAIDGYRPMIAELLQDGLLEQVGDRLCLTSRGRLLSNEVFGRFLRDKAVQD
jgi:oxygen-independent coproporphyrinogen-3 oxidase